MSFLFYVYVCDHHTSPLSLKECKFLERTLLFVLVLAFACFSEDEMTGELRLKQGLMNTCVFIQDPCNFRICVIKIQMKIIACDFKTVGKAH